MSADISDAAVSTLAGLLEQRTGQQLAIGRRWRIDVALRPLVATEGARSLDDLVHRAAGGRDPALADRVVEALLNHETFFFRDARAFAQFAEHGLGRLHAARQDARRLRLWSAGCSTGQEAYTLAMLIADQPERWAGWRIDIVGTDLSPAAIRRAQAGDYSHFEIQRGLPVAHMVRRFEPAAERWRAAPALRAMVRFHVHNLLDPPPPGPFDAVLCRNVLLYFASAVRRLVFARIASVIAPDGVLMLGAGETTMGQTDQFVSDYICRGLHRPRVELCMRASA